MSSPVRLPRVGQVMAQATIQRVLVTPGASVGIGTPLFEGKVDLGVGDQDCPPGFFFRVVSRETGVVECVVHQSGDLLSVGEEVLRVARTKPGASPDRDLRVSSVIISIDPLFG